MVRWTHCVKKTAQRGRMETAAVPAVPGSMPSRLVEEMPVSDVVAVPPRAHARIVYLGPVSPHWEVYSDYGERSIVEEFRARVLARLVLIQRDDPQFRRNRERVVRDAEREA